MAKGSASCSAKGARTRAIKSLIARINFDEEEIKLRAAIDPGEGRKPLSAQRKQKAIKRLKIVASFNRRVDSDDPASPRLNDPRAMHYESVVAGTGDAFDWPVPEEHAAAGICYTSGTTGNPKGVAYSQKTTYLHALASRAVDSFAVQERDTILMLPSMFHANAWGFPYSGWMSGADMVMPGPHLQGAHLRAMIEQARPTLTAMVPTILGDLLAADEESPLDLS